MDNNRFVGDGFQSELFAPEQQQQQQQQVYAVDTVKLHHGPNDADSCCVEYVSSRPAEYTTRDPPSYVESSAFFHPLQDPTTGFYRGSGAAPSCSEFERVRAGGRFLVPKPDPDDPGLMRKCGADRELGGGIGPVKSKRRAEGSALDDVFESGLCTTASDDGPPVGKDETALGGGDDGASRAGADPEKKSCCESSPDVKPALSYIALIAKAILESSQKRLSLGSIYSWIEKNYPYYQNKGQGWRNSVRHNLSLNDCFVKAGRCEDGKGNYWAIHPANIQDFLRGDFRQRRRSRRRGRKRECDVSVYPVSNGYLGPGATPIAPAISFNPSPALSTIYSPYTEAERRAYRLDEALLRQSMNNPFVKWYHNSMANGTYATPSTNSSSQWQTYPDNGSQYQLNSTFPRNYSPATLV